MSKITVQPAKMFPKAWPAERSSGETAHRSSESTFVPVKPATRPSSQLIRKEKQKQHRDDAIGLERHLKTTSRVREPAACVCCLSSACISTWEPVSVWRVVSPLLVLRRESQCQCDGDTPSSGGLCVHEVHGCASPNCRWKTVRKSIPESSKKQGRNVPQAGNYLHSIYIVFATVYTATHHTRQRQ